MRLSDKKYFSSKYFAQKKISADDRGEKSDQIKVERAIKFLSLRVKSERKKKAVIALFPRWLSIIFMMRSAFWNIADRSPIENERDNATLFHTLLLLQLFPRG